MKSLKKPTKEQLKKFALEHAWATKMSNGSSLVGWSNYSGEDKGDAVIVVGRNRDSGILDESNFESALKMLGGESKTVKIGHFGHWACGWFELILVDPKDKKALLKAFEIKQSLEDYPVLDESDYSERESEEYFDYAKGASKQLAEGLSKHFIPDVKPTNRKLIQLAIELNVENQYQGGEDSCLNIYAFRIPENREIKELYEAIKGIDYRENKDKLFNQLKEAVEAKLGIFKVKILKAKKGDASKQGIHILEPSEEELAQAVEQAERDMFPIIYTHTKATWPKRGGK